MPKYIYVKNLPVQAEPKDLERVCGEFGKVTDVDVLPDGASRKARISMDGGHEAAAEALDGRMVSGAEVTARVVINHEEQYG